MSSTLLQPLAVYAQLLVEIAPGPADQAGSVAIQGDEPYLPDRRRVGCSEPGADEFRLASLWRLDSHPMLMETGFKAGVGANEDGIDEVCSRGCPDASRAAAGHGNPMATQPGPERSKGNGLALVRQFLDF